MIEKPRLVFRVGISGHRPDRLEVAGADESVLRERVKTALQLVADTVRGVHRESAPLYAPGELVLRIISPLAEGADRLCAEVALEPELGFELNVLLPFEQANYEKTFASDESVQQFRDRLSQARRVLELDSEEGDYASVGITTVRQCDLLLAIWDGGPARGRGGVKEIVAEALRIELPTLWIDARGAKEHAMGLAEKLGGEIVKKLWNPAEVAERVRLLLSLPTSVDRSKHADALNNPALVLTCVQGFFAEQPCKPAFQGSFEMAKRFFARGWEQDAEYRNLCSKSYVTAPIPEEDRFPVDGDEWAQDLAKSVARSDWTQKFDELRRAIGGSLGRTYVDADWLAIRYASLHRDYTVRSFLFYAPVVVLFAFLSFALHGKFRPSLGLGLAEVVLIGVIWWRHHQNVQGRYHEKWLDYRSIAEKLRHALILAPLGRPTLEVQLPVSLAASDQKSHWTNWYLRARIREEGLVPGRLHDRKYTEALRTLLWRWLVRRQIRYHAELVAKMRTARRRVHAWRDRFFVAAAVAAGVHVLVAVLSRISHAFHEWEGDNKWLGVALSAATVFFPAVVAALHGYSHQADFENTTMRSQAELRRLLQADEELSTHPSPSVLDLLFAVGLTTESTLAELAEWRHSARLRPPDLP